MASASSTGQFAAADFERLGSFFAQVSKQLARPALEFSLLLADPVFWGWGVQRGDGHSVLVLPGLGGGDSYLLPLRRWLSRIGYRPVDSGIDVNPGWSEELLDEMAALAAQEFRRSRSKVTIIGHSLGGIIGYVIAAHQPKMVRQVVTLGAPLQLIRNPLPSAVPLIAFYSRSDSIVPHPAALARDRHARNFEVDSSHIGMASHPEIYRRLVLFCDKMPTQMSGRNDAHAIRPDLITAGY